MATKLKNLRVRKVDFVPEGANQEAHVLLYKNKEGAPAPPPPQGGEERSPSFLQKILSAVGVSAIGKAFGLSEEQIVGAIQNLAKEAETFDDRMQEVNRERIYGEIWDTVHALSGSLCSIIQDDEVTDKAPLMSQSLTEFTQAMEGFIATWAGGSPADINKAASEPAHLELLRKHQEYLDNVLQNSALHEQAPSPGNPTEPAGPPPAGETAKGEQTMNVDKSKMTPEELAAYEALEKKYGLPEEGDPTPPPADGVGKGAEGTPPPVQEPPAQGDDDVYKGLHPAVKAELESLRKMREAMEDRELLDVAKRYEIIGRKPEELVPTLKALKSAGGDAYTQMIALLDENVATLEKSGLFREIGKSGAGSADAWTVIEKKADEIQKAAPELSREQAVDRACQQHPELVREYEQALR